MKTNRKHEVSLLGAATRFVVDPGAPAAAHECERKSRRRNYSFGFSTMYSSSCSKKYIGPQKKSGPQRDDDVGKSFLEESPFTHPGLQTHPPAHHVAAGGQLCGPCEPPWIAHGPNTCQRLPSLLLSASAKEHQEHRVKRCLFWSLPILHRSRLLNCVVLGCTRKFPHGLVLMVPHLVLSQMMKALFKWKMPLKFFFRCSPLSPGSW